eukprot:1378447-Amphidinium_carterae.1
MQANASWGHSSMHRQASFTSFFVPVGAVVHNMLQVLNIFATPDTDVTHLESRARAFFMPHSSKSRV